MELAVCRHKYLAYSGIFCISTLKTGARYSAIIYTRLHNTCYIANSKSKSRSSWRNFWLHVFGHEFFVRNPFKLSGKGSEIWLSSTRLNPFPRSFRGVQADPREILQFVWARVLIIIWIWIIRISRITTMPPSPQKTNIYLCRPFCAFRKKYWQQVISSMKMCERILIIFYPSAKALRRVPLIFLIRLAGLYHEYHPKFLSD